MNEWQEHKLGDLYDVSSGLSKPADQFGFGHTFISFKDVFNNYFIPEYPEGLVNSNEKDWKSCSVKKGDILITRTSETIEEVGMSSVALKDYEKSTFNGFCKRLRLKENTPIKVSPHFMGYLLRTRFFRKTVANFATMTTRASLNGESIKSIPLKFPPYEIQEEIGMTLYSLEKKISLLRQQNQTLEELAQTLFKRWFVENENPEWELKSLSEIVDVKIGRTPPRKEEQWFSKNDEDVKWVSIKDLGESGVYILNTSEYLTQEAVDKFKIPLIQEKTVLLSFKMTLGRVGIATETMVSNEAIAQFIPKRKEISPEFLYFYLKTFKYQKLGSTSSIVTSINSGMIKDMPISVPDTDSLSQFSNAVKSIFEKIKSNSIEIQTLTQLRDTLLPKLMSGELKVKEYNHGS